MLGNHFPNGANAVADHRSVFVGVRVCGSIHLQRKFLEEFGRLSVEDFAGRLDPFEVAFRIDARPGAKADVHGQAALRKQFFAIANAEVPPEQLHDLFGRGRIWEGAPFLAPFGGCRVYMIRGKASPVSTRYGKDLSSLSRELNLGRCSRSADARARGLPAASA